MQLIALEKRSLESWTLPISSRPYPSVPVRIVFVSVNWNTNTGQGDISPRPSVPQGVFLRDTDGFDTDESRLFTLSIVCIQFTAEYDSWAQRGP